MRNARTEAVDRLGGRDARVLEPSPPTVTEGPFFADDPASAAEAAEAVGPTSAFATTWDDVASGDVALARYAADHWLGAWRRLEPAPDGLAGTRRSLHRIAEHVMKPAREAANGKFGLRYTYGGFGTPYYGDDVQLRVEGVELIRESADGSFRLPLTTLGAAASLAGVELEADDGPLEADARAGAFLGDWFGFAASVLEELRATAPDALEPSRVQLWPEHFDLAAELGPEAGGTRAAYGLSPGDDVHDEPYVYVAPWEPDRIEAGDLWNASAFKGAELPYAEIVAAGDQRAFTAAWLQARLDALTAASG